MKLSLFFMFGFVLCASARVEAQQEKVNLELKEVLVKTLFDEIQKQTRLSFVFNTDQVRSLGPLSVTARNETVESVLERVLRNTGITCEFEGNLIVVRPTVQQREEKRITLSGMVRDEKGDPIPGATLQIKGTTLGSVTNAEGKFSLSLPEQEGMVLIISFIGHKSQEILVTESNVLTIVLEEEVQAVGEIVVNGYYMRDKESFTGSAISVGREELKQVSSGNLISALQVFDPAFRIRENTEMGSDPNTLPNFRIRGNSGFGAEGLTEANLRNDPNLPTFILDGYEVSVEKIFDLNLDRIENVTILKDASATAIYGSRAANGVVVVTTVAPEPGRLRLSYQLNMAITVPDLSDYRLLNARDKLRAEAEAGLYETDDIYSWQLLRKDYAERLERVEQGVDTYWLSQPLRTALGHKHSLYVEGGDKSVRYGIDLNYQGNPGVMKKSLRDRFGLGFLLSYNLNNKLLFRNRLSVDRVKSKASPYGSFREYARANPYERIYDDDGQMIRSYQPNVSTTNRFLNPLYEASLNHKDRTSYTEWTNNFDLDWFINDHFRFKARVSYSERNDQQETFTDPASAVYDQYEYQEGEGLLKRGEAYSFHEKSSNLDLNAVLTFNRHLGNHFLNGVMGINLIESRYRNEAYRVIGFPAGNIDYISFGKEFKDLRPEGSEGLSRLSGAFVNLNYSWNNIYLLDLSGRLDGSSKFGTDKRYAPFWSVGIGWNVHHQNFFRLFRDVVSHLKVTANVGQTGKASFEAYEAQNVYEYYRGQWYAGGLGVLMNRLGNPALQWEKTRMFDMNFEIQLWNGRVSATANYYIKRTHDLLADISLPLSSGFESYRDNLGELENKGYEISARGFLFRERDLVVSLSGSLAHNSNTIKKISNSLQSYNDKVDKEQDEYEVPWGGTLETARPIVQFKEGNSTTAIYAVKSHGINPMNGKEVYEDRQGNLVYQWRASDKAVCGDTEPKLSGVFGVNADWKGLGIAMNFLWQCGGQVYNQTLVDRVENANLNWNVDRRVFEGRWKQPGDHTFFKDIRDRNRTEVSSRFVQDENVLQFKSLSLSYDFSRELLRRWGIDRLKLTFLTEDIFRVSNVKRERGLDYPFARTCNIGLQLQF